MEMNQSLSHFSTLLMCYCSQFIDELNILLKYFRLKYFFNGDYPKLLLFCISNIRENRRHVSESNLLPTKVILPVNIFFTIHFSILNSTNNIYDLVYTCNPWDRSVQLESIYRYYTIQIRHKVYIISPRSQD